MKNAILIMLIIMGFVSCKENLTAPEEKNPGFLFKASFINNWLMPQDGEAILFISDTVGNILVDTTWTGNDSLELYINKSLPDSIVQNLNSINVTVATLKNINTYMDVPIGSSWIFSGFNDVYLNNPQYSADFSFSNLPEVKFINISSLWSQSINALSPSYHNPIGFNFYISPMDIIVKISTTNNINKYIWLESLTEGSYTIDFENMNQPNYLNMSIPENNGYRKYVYGINGSGYWTDGHYLIDQDRDYSSTQSINLYFPPNKFNKYRTSIYVIEELNKSEWYQSVYGDLRSSFTKIDASFDIVSSSIDNFEISTQGDYLEICSIWHTADHSILWNVYSDKEISKYQLPKFPVSMNRILNIERSNFKLWLVELNDFPELSSYNDILTILSSGKYFYDSISELTQYTKYPFNGLNKSSKENVEPKYIRLDPHEFKN